MNLTKLQLVPSAASSELALLFGLWVHLSQSPGKLRQQQSAAPVRRGHLHWQFQHSLMFGCYQNTEGEACPCWTLCSGFLPIFAPIIRGKTLHPSLDNTWITIPKWSVLNCDPGMCILEPNTLPQIEDIFEDRWDGTMRGALKWKTGHQQTRGKTTRRHREKVVTCKTWRKTQGLDLGHPASTTVRKSRCCLNTQGSGLNIRSGPRLMYEHSVPS